MCEIEKDSCNVSACCLTHCYVAIDIMHSIWSKSYIIRVIYYVIDKQSF